MRGCGEPRGGLRVVRHCCEQLWFGVNVYLPKSRIPWKSRVTCQTRRLGNPDPKDVLAQKANLRGLKLAESFYNKSIVVNFFSQSETELHTLGQKCKTYASRYSCSVSTDIRNPTRRSCGALPHRRPVTGTAILLRCPSSTRHGLNASIPRRSRGERLFDSPFI
jgi:hypothetical protein